MNTKIWNFLIIAVLVWCWSLPAGAQSIPNVMNFQSALFDVSGNPITQDQADILFRIVDINNTELYIEEQPAVQVFDGLINVLIGTGVVPGSNPPVPTGGLSTAALNPTGPLFLEVTVGSITTLEPLELASVPYAYYAERALSIDPMTVTFQDIGGQITATQLPVGNEIVTVITDAGDMDLAGTSITNVTTVDGVDISILNLQAQDHETRIINLENKIVDETGIATRLRPSVYGTATITCGDNLSNLQNGYNVASVAGNGRVNFSAPVATPYTVIATHNNPDVSQGAQLAVTMRDGNGFNVNYTAANPCSNTTIDFIVWKL